MAYHRLACAILVGWATLAAASGARAADLDVIAYRPPPVAAPTFTWAGYYFGVYGGGAFGKSQHDAPWPTGNFDVSGAVFGGTIGFNFMAGGFVAGIEFDAGWANVTGNAPNNCFGGICQTQSSGLVTLRGRAGPALGRFLPYLTAGIAFGEINPTTAIGTASTYMTGYAAGAGLEVALTQAWLAKLEYLYIDLGHYDCGPCGLVVADRVTFSANVVRAGLNYKFDW